MVMAGEVISLNYKGVYESFHVIFEGLDAYTQKLFMPRPPQP